MAYNKTNGLKEKKRGQKNVWFDAILFHLYASKCYILVSIGEDLWKIWSLYSLWITQHLKCSLTIMHTALRAYVRFELYVNFVVI